MVTLREALIDIFGVDPRYVIPLNSHEYVPTYDKEDKVGTWVGYRILEKSTYARGYEQVDGMVGTQVRPVKIRFRISLVGPQAEELADAMFLWDDRRDVAEAFEKRCLAQLNYDKRHMYSFPVEEGGMNDRLCWCVDFNAQSFYTYSVKGAPWGYVIEPQGDIKVKGDL